MKIVIFTDAYPPFINGVATSTYNLVQSLRAHEHEVLVVAPKAVNGPTEIVDGTIYMSGIELKNFYGYRLTQIYSSKVYKMVKNFKPDLMHIQTDFTVGQFGKICARKLKKIPSVYTYHTAYEDYTHYVTHGMADRFVKKFVRSYSKNYAKTVTEYITPSEKTMNYLRSAGSDVHVNIVPTGLDFSLFQNRDGVEEKIKEFKKEHNIDEDTKVILLLGRIAAEKSMDVSIRGFHAFRTMYPDFKCKLLVVGDGPQKAELQQMVYDLKEEDFVEFLGKKNASEVPFYYQLADMYTSASITETQGLTFMESMASGTIVLARFDVQLSETIIDEETGYFFSDLDSFATQTYKILTLSDQDKQLIVENAYKFVDKYSIDKFYENIMRVYKRAVRKKW